MRAIRVARSRVLGVAPGTAWALIADPASQPGWWPELTRVEGVAPGRFTQVLTSRRGRAVRADFTVTASEPPQRLEWTQELAGTPFARVLESSQITFALSPSDGRVDATHLELCQVQRPLGASRGGGLLLRRATGRRLDAALDGLAHALGE